MSELTKYTIFERVEKQDNGCWHWNGSTGRSLKITYGRVYYKGRTMNAHRVAYMLYHGVELPRHIVVCHKCDNGLCINPDHLFIGTMKDNVQDCIAKGRRVANNLKLSKCKYGHDYTEDNTYRNKRGHRECKKCLKICADARYQRIKAMKLKGKTNETI